MFVYGTVFGGLAVQAGLRPVEVWAMSVLVFAGASQFVAVPMIAAGAPIVAIVVTTYVVNMRHYLMAATLAPSFRGFPRRWLAVIAHLINDESFAVAVARSQPPDAGVYLGSAAAISGSFLAGVGVGTVLGGLVQDPERYGLDFAFPAVFLALVAVQLRRRSDWLVAVGAAVLAVALALVLPGNWHIVVAGLVASAVGALVLPPRGRRVRFHVWLTILGMAVATYLTRAPMFLALARRPLPPRMRLWLRLVPLAVLPALAIPLVLVRDGRLAASLAHPPLWGAVVVLVLAARGVNLLVSVTCAVTVVALLRALG